MDSRSLLLALLLLPVAGCNLQQVRLPGSTTGPAIVATAAAAPATARPAVSQGVTVATRAAPAPAIPATKLPVQTAVTAPAPAPEPEAPPANLWHRIEAGLELGDIEHPRIDQHVKWLKSHPNYLGRVAERADPYLYLITEEVEKRGMPLELAMLPIVESSFQPFAYSHGSAAGLWQFIPSTGRLFGLKQNWWYDGRRDVVASTTAALDYLDKLQKIFDGDWLLALASYNAGEGTVIRAQRRNKAKGKPTDYWSLDLPRETEAYIPKLLAVSRVFTAPADYELEVPQIDNRPRLTLVQTGSQIDLAKAAKLAELSVDELYRLNPGFNRWATDPEGPHHLLVPLESAEAFRTGLAALDDSERLQWRRHKIASGESLISIARKYHTTPEVLRAANDIEGNLIRAGRHILIPVASANASVYALSADQRRSRLGSGQPAGASKVVHTVRAGDNLWDIGRRYGVTTRQLANWNGIGTSSTLRLGQKLSVWVDGKSGGSPAVAMTRKSISYTVRSGDSLARISQRFKVTIANLIEWNGLDRNAYLQPGQKLTLHIDVTRQSSTG